MYGTNTYGLSLGPAADRGYGAAPLAPQPTGYGLSPLASGITNDEQLQTYITDLAKQAQTITGSSQDNLISSAYRTVAQYAKANPNSALAQQVLDVAHKNANGRQYPTIS